MCSTLQEQRSRSSTGPELTAGRVRRRFQHSIIQHSSGSRSTFHLRFVMGIRFASILGVLLHGEGFLFTHSLKRFVGDTTSGMIRLGLRSFLVGFVCAAMLGSGFSLGGGGTVGA